MHFTQPRASGKLYAHHKGSANECQWHIGPQHACRGLRALCFAHQPNCPVKGTPIRLRALRSPSGRPLPLALGGMKVERATIADAPRISALILQLSRPFLASPSGEGAEPFLAAISEPAIQGYISATNFEYFVAESQGLLAGVVALRDNSHLFHLFVAEPFQGQGLGGKLWHTVKARALQSGNPGSFTVNSSLNAQPVYEKFGFVVSGPAVQTHGVKFQPMQLSQAHNAA